MSTLELQGVCKVHADGTRAVDGIDLGVDDGEFFVLVGPSGCGKTTILRMIAGLEPVSGGTVLIDGIPVDDVPANARDVALVFQDNVLYPHLTVADNIGFALSLAKLSRAEIERRVAATAKQLQVDHLLDRFPSQLSGGQRQRVAMGRAIIRTPRLLLMDEPMSNLDAKLRTETRAQILGIQQLLGVTTVYVTHDQVEAMAMGDRVAVLRDGRIVQCGTPLELYDEPADLFVARFIGTPPMNVVAAMVTSVDDRPALQLGRCAVVLDDRASARLPGVLGLVGRRVALGFRPEAVRPDPDGPFVVSAVTVEHRGVDQLVTARFDAPEVRQTPDSIEVSDDTCSMINISLPVRYRVDLWQPIPLTIDLSSITLFDLATGSRYGRSAAGHGRCLAPTVTPGVSTTCLPSTPWCG